MTTLAESYEAFLFDLDGVLFRGDEAIPGAAPTLEALRARGAALVFITNNSSRTPQQVAAKLEGLGFAASAEEVVTSAQATAELLSRRADGRSRTAYVIGRDGVREALSEAGFEVLDGEPEDAGFVVIGWEGEVTYDALRRASVLVRGGSTLVATNLDASYPAPGGELWPGAGAILSAVETASGTRAALVGGKPHPPLFETALARAGTRAALVVGDRVDTDIEGAAAAGLDGALVTSGASSAAELLDVDAVPVALLRDVRGLLDSPAFGPVAPAREDQLAEVRALTRSPEDVPPWGPEGVWVLGADPAAATATAEVRGDDAYLRAVATREELRGRGLGTLVVAAALRGARRRGARRAWLLTETAESLFASLGFEPVARSSMPRWIDEGPAETCPAGAVPMRRELAQESQTRSGSRRPR